jgi:hypothetical protein
MIDVAACARALGVAAIVAVSVAPAYAGPAEIALLKSYQGSWKGQGQLVGGDKETVTCRMSLSQGNNDKVNYSGRCLIAGNNLSISGTLAYIEAAHRYEGAMTSNANFSGVAIGQKTGNGITFNLQSRGTGDQSNMKIGAGITLTPAGIVVDFTATDINSGKSAHATVPFTRT